MALGGIDEEIKNEEVEKDEAVEKKKKKPFHYWMANGEEYKLKLTTSMIEKLENKYRTNVMNLVITDDIPPLTVMLTIAQAAIAPWQHKVGYEKVKEIYENWKENDGGNQMKFYTDVIMPTMAVSGFFTDEQAEVMMKNMKDADMLM